MSIVKPGFYEIFQHKIANHNKVFLSPLAMIRICQFFGQAHDPITYMTEIFGVALFIIFVLQADNVKCWKCSKSLINAL